MGNMRNFISKYEEKRSLRRRRCRQEVIINKVLKKYGLNLWTGSKWLRKRSSGIFCERGNEPSGSIKI